MTADPTRRVRLGILVPSSNTALEPLTQALVSTLPGVSVHFARFRVTQISLAPDALAQFDHEHILDAARLLTDAGVDAIGWSGTAAGWLGFAADEQLCESIMQATGKPATTSVLALNKALRALDVKKLGLVTPYTADVQERIVDNYGKIGVDVTAERHLSRVDNLTIADVDAHTLNGMVAEVVREGVQAITTFCTNLSAAHHVVRWEEKHGVPVLDTVATVVWDLLRMTGVQTDQLEPWGMLFQIQ